MQNYYRWIGHYKNIVSDSLCDNIISTDFNYTRSIGSNRSNSRNNTPSSSPKKSPSKNYVRVGTSIKSPLNTGSPKSSRINP